MKKAIWLLLLTTLLACGPSTTDLRPADTDTEEAAANNAAETNDEVSASDNAAPAAANLDDFSPAGTVEEAAVIREQDWRKGAVDPAVVIIEYGDFQ